MIECTSINSDLIIVLVSAILIRLERRTFILGEFLQSHLISEWHQYDGIMSREPEGGFWATVGEKIDKVTGKHYERLVKRTKEAVTAMLPSWDEIQVTDLKCAKNLLEKLDQVCFCAKNNFVDDKLTPDETKMKEVSRQRHIKDDSDIITLQSRIRCVARLCTIIMYF